jgi:aminoglycoside phosphotransferase (APT) family kinase protein
MQQLLCNNANLGRYQFGLGNSNPTYQLTAHNGSKYVLRKKPPQVLISKTAHNIEREYRIMRALAMTDLPVPKTYCLCEDKDIIGTPFYLMSFIQGRIFEDPALPGIHPADRTSM